MRLTVDGTQVNATTGGAPLDRDRPLVVFVHGAGMDRTLWSLHTRFFPTHGWSVLAVDLPGHGRSDGPPLERIEAMGEWLVRVIRAAGWERAALVGHSMGSLAALHAAGTEPGLATHLVIAGGSDAMHPHPELMAAAATGAHLAIELVMSWSLTPDGRVGGNRSPGMWLTGGGIRMMERSTPGLLGIDLAACNAYSDAIEAACHVSCPSLVLVGERDVMTRPSGAAALAAAIDGSITTTIRDTGHLMMLERPDATLDAIAGFLGTPPP